MLTGIVGFANDFTKIARGANAVLELNPDLPLGEHTLCLKRTVDIKPNAEILLAYGPKSEFCKAPKRKRILMRRCFAFLKEPSPWTNNAFLMSWRLLSIAKPHPK